MLPLFAFKVMRAGAGLPWILLRQRTARVVPFTLVVPRVRPQLQE
jgi:hypothetical protein